MSTLAPYKPTSVGMNQISQGSNVVLSQEKFQGAKYGTRDRNIWPIPSTQNLGKGLASAVVSRIVLSWGRGILGPVVEKPNRSHFFHPTPVSRFPNGKGSLAWLEDGSQSEILLTLLSYLASE